MISGEELGQSSYINIITLLIFTLMYFTFVMPTPITYTFWITILSSFISLKFIKYDRHRPQLYIRTILNRMRKRMKV